MTRWTYYNHTCNKRRQHLPSEQGCRRGSWLPWTGRQTLGWRNPRRRYQFKEPASRWRQKTTIFVYSRPRW